MFFLNGFNFVTFICRILLLCVRAHTWNDFLFQAILLVTVSNHLQSISTYNIILIYYNIIWSILLNRFLDFLIFQILLNNLRNVEWWFDPNKIFAIKKTLTAFYDSYTIVHTNVCTLLSLFQAHIVSILLDTHVYF